MLEQDATEGVGGKDQESSGVRKPKQATKTNQAILRSNKSIV